MKLIPLTQGQVAMVDDEDFERVSKYNWYACKARKYGYYAVTNIYINGVRTLLRMHRLIIIAEKGNEIDHINNERLDNRRCNLRSITHSQNIINSNILSAKTSKYRGICYHKKVGKFKASIGFNNKSYHLGYFKNEIDAMLAYNKKAIELHGEFAGLNTPTFEDQFKCYLRGETNVMPNKIKEV